MRRNQVLVFVPYSINKISNAPTVRAWNMYNNLKAKVNAQLICGSFIRRIFEEIIYLLSGKNPACVYIEAVASKMFLLDYIFLGLLRKKGSIICPYIRDIYWEFPRLFKMDMLRRRMWYCYSKKEMNWYFKNATVLFFQSSSMANMIDFSVKELLPPGGDALRCSESKIPFNKHIVYIGGIEETLGVDILAEAMERVVKIHPDAYCSIVGKGNLELLSKWKNCKWINVYSLLYRDVPEVLSNAYVCVVPREAVSYSNLVLPVKLFDYMSSGRPVVVTNCREMADFVRENKIGIVTEDNPESLACGILRLLENRRLAEEYGKNALSAIHSKHSWSRRVDKLLDTTGKL